MGVAALGEGITTVDCGLVFVVCASDAVCVTKTCVRAISQALSVSLSVHLDGWPNWASINSGDFRISNGFVWYESNTWQQLGLLTVNSTYECTTRSNTLQQIIMNLKPNYPIFCLFGVITVHYWYTSYTISRLFFKLQKLIDSEYIYADVAVLGQCVAGSW